MLRYQISEIQVIHEAQLSNRFGEFAYCSSHVLANGRGLGEHTLIYNIFFFSFSAGLRLLQFPVEMSLISFSSRYFRYKSYSSSQTYTTSHTVLVQLVQLQKITATSSYGTFLRPLKSPVVLRQSVLYSVPSFQNATAAVVNYSDLS